MNKALQIFRILVFFFMLSCKDDPKSTPTPTPVEIEDEWPTFVDTGANVVAYKVDGKVRVSKNISTVDTEKVATKCLYLINDVSKLLYFEGNRITDTLYQSVYFDISNIIDTGRYKIMGTEGASLAVYLEGKSYPQSTPYSTNNVDSGYMHISKIDTFKRIICGEFEFTGRDFFGSEKKKITEGRFDLKYRR